MYWQESRPRSESSRPSGIDNFLPRGIHDIWSCTIDGIDLSDPPLYRCTVIPCGERACDGERGRKQSQILADNSGMTSEIWNRKGHLTDWQAGINMYVGTRIHWKARSATEVMEIRQYWHRLRRSSTSSIRSTYLLRPRSCGILSI